MKKSVSCDPDKCVGCQICEYICRITMEKVLNPLKSRIRVVRQNQLVNMAVACRLREDPPCVAACPRDDISQSEETRVILVDRDKCNGCGWSQKLAITARAPQLSRKKLIRCTHALW